MDTVASAAARSLVSIRQPVQGVPDGMRLTQVSPIESGFRATLTGSTRASPTEAHLLKEGKFDSWGAPIVLPDNRTNVDAVSTTATVAGGGPARSPLVARYDRPLRFYFLSTAIPWAPWFTAGYLSRSDHPNNLLIAVLGMAGSCWLPWPWPGR